MNLQKRKTERMKKIQNDMESEEREKSLILNVDKMQSITEKGS